MNESSERSSGSSPLVSVVMPAYNAGRFLREAIESIVDQTLTDWELVIVNDGSTDDTADILTSFADPRIRIITHASNQGLVAALNAGVSAARGHSIARLDADDIALPERLERQVAFLAAHPDVGIVGSTAVAIDVQGRRMRTMWRPIQPAAVKFLSLLETPLHHPTILARSEVLKTHPYDKHYTRSEDYDLWSRLIFDHGIVVMNLREPLTLFRQHPKSFTRASGDRGLEFVIGVPLRNIARYIVLSERDRAVISTYRRGMPMTLGQLLRFAILLATLAVRFCWRERPALAALPAIKRITLGTLWRALRRYGRHGLKHNSPK